MVRWIRCPARPVHQAAAARWAPGRPPGKDSPAKKLPRTNWTIRSTRGLSAGRRTRAGSTTNPRSWAYSANARFSRGSSGWARSTIAAMLSGMTTLKIAAEERPRRLEPGDHRGQVLAEGQPHEHVPGIDRGEDQGVHHPAAPSLQVVKQAHLPEVDLAFGAWLAVGHPHRRLAAAAMTQHLKRVAVQRPLRDHHTLPGQQLPGLHHRQARIQQLLQPRVMRRQQRPARPVPISPVRADPLSHGAQQLIPELFFTPGPVQATCQGRLHIPPDRLTVHLRQPGHRAKPLTPQPQPQHFPDLVHANLPERHTAALPDPLNGLAASVNRAAAASAGPRSGVVP